jgi:hypothetical protein
MTRRMLHEGLHCDGLNQDSLSCDGGLLPGEGRHHHDDGLHHDDDDDRRYDGLHQEGGREGREEGLLRAEGHNNNGLRQNEV